MQIAMGVTLKCEFFDQTGCCLSVDLKTRSNYDNDSKVHLQSIHMVANSSLLLNLALTSAKTHFIRLLDPANTHKTNSYYGACALMSLPSNSISQ